MVEKIRMALGRNENDNFRFKKGSNGYRIHLAVAQAGGNAQARLDVINAANHGARGSQGDTVTALKGTLWREQNEFLPKSLDLMTPRPKLRSDGTLQAQSQSRHLLTTQL
jgi:hypothetical protein